MPIRNYNFTYLEYRDDGGYSAKIMQLLEEMISKVCKQDCNQVTGYTHEDLAQELRFHLWRKIPYYNPKYSLKTWGYKVINNKINDLRRSSTAQKRLIQYFTYNTGDEERTENTIR